MSRKTTKPSKLIPVTVLLDTQLVPQIQTRMTQLDINRSQYFRRLVKADISGSTKQPA